MLTRNRIIRTFSIFVITLGALVIHRSEASAEEQSGDCVWCTASCPGDLGQFCQTHCTVPVGAGNCAVKLCQGQSGTWYVYTVTCPRLQ